MPRWLPARVLVVACLCGGLVAAQDVSPRPDAPFTVLAREGRRALPAFRAGNADLVALADLASVFQLTVQEDALGLTVGYKGQTIVLAPGQTLASVGGRLISLPSGAVRGGGSWLVPVEFVDRALALLYDAPLDLRKSSRLIVVGDLRVPRVIARTEESGSLSRVTFDLIPRVAQTVTQEPGRLVVRFQADAVDATIEPIAPGSIVEALQVAEAGTSVTIHLGPRFGSYRSEATGSASSGRLVVELLAAGADSAAATPAPAPVPDPNVSIPVFETPDTALRTVVIDPGHGGDDSGARGPGGTLEKDVTLAVARRLKGMIEARLGLRVLLTRDRDEMVRVDERAALANNNKAHLFLSLHANASPQPRVAGAEVFYLSIAEYGEEARRLAAAAPPTLPVFGGGTRAVDVTLWEMAQAPHLDDSAVLARITEDQLRARVPMSDRALQQAPFRALVGANMPAVLVEMGFLTNPEQERQLGSEGFQTTVAQALLQTVVRFRDHLERGRASDPLQADTAAPVPSAGTRPGTP